ncbi:nuclear transport factor 2 family protein [Yinghuangia sp. YIM S09857]|uniref:nuclear transport factor 2 family protein n=1 Tax=Yinghuangia sp. YIM S09857 TaxID=3436929 RepID=UPI003F52DC0B
MLSTDALTVSTVSDRLEIADLFARLSKVLDDQAHDDAHEVFAHDAVVLGRAGELRGIDELVAFLRQSVVEGVATQHVNADVLVRVDGDRATATASQLVYFWREGEPPHQESGLRTDCTAVRTDAGWRFDDMRITVAWTRTE